MVILIVLCLSVEFSLHVTIKSSCNEGWDRSSAHGSFSINLMDFKYIHVNTMATARSEYAEVTVATGSRFGEIYEAVKSSLLTFFETLGVVLFVCERADT